MSLAGLNHRRSHRHLGGENRFYSPPPLPNDRQEQEQEQEQEQDQRSTSSESDGPGSDCSDSSHGTTCEVSNLWRFVEYITPHVPAQFFPMKSQREWKTVGEELQPYFVLGDLWDSIKEWSVYGAGVPLMLNGSEAVTQYYHVSLSAIQLYTDPSKHSPQLSQKIDHESTRGTSSDRNNGYCNEKGAYSTVYDIWNQPDLSNASNHGPERVSLRSEPFTVSSSDEAKSYNPLGQLVFEYFEHKTPYKRELFTDKINDLACQFPELNTYKSCDLAPASWVSLAWYPIYRIPNGPTLKSLNACFLTFHSLSTALQSPIIDGFHVHCSRDTELSLSVFGLAFYKLKVSAWDPDGISEGQKAYSLLEAADNWIRLLQVNHPDYNYFMSHWR